MFDLTYSVLGAVRAWRAGEPLELGPRQQRLVLAVLLLNANRSVSSSAIVKAVWGAKSVSSAENSVRVHIHRLRGVIGSAIIESTAGGYLLHAAPGAVDVDLLQTALRAADGSEAAEVLRTLVGTRFEVPLSDVRGDYVDSQREALRTLWLNGAEKLAELEIELGDPWAAAVVARRALAIEPLRERLHELLVLAQRISGNHTVANDAYYTATRLLRRELGVGPSLRLRETLEEVRAATSPFTQVTSRQERPFVGRESSLQFLDMACDGDRPVLITGMAGVGKTTLVRQWAQRADHRFPDGVAHLDLRGFTADSPLEPASALVALLGMLGVSTMELPASLTGLASYYRSVIADRRHLIVLDNAHSTEQVRHLLPGTSNSFAVITSRTVLPGLVATTGAQHISLDVLTQNQSVDLLIALAGRGRVEADRTATERIVSACGNLPLALEIVAARENVPFGVIADELGEEGLNAFGGEHGVDLRSMLSWSLQALPPEAVRLFDLLSLHPGTTFSLHAAASLADLQVRVARTVLRRLADHNLIRAVEPNRFGWHDLVRTCSLDRARIHVSETDAHEAMTRLYSHFARTAHDGFLRQYESDQGPGLPSGIPQVAVEPLADGLAATRWFYSEHDALTALIEDATATGFGSYVAPLAWYTRVFHITSGRWQEMLRVNHAALLASTATGDRLHLAYAHRSLSYAEDWLGNPDAAAEHLDAAAGLFRAEADHVALGYLLGEATIFASRRGDHARSSELHAEARESFAREGHSAGLAHAQNSLAWSLIHQNRPKETLRAALVAEELFTEAGPRLFATSSALMASALAAEMLGLRWEAWRLYLRCGRCALDSGASNIIHAVAKAETRLRKAFYGTREPSVPRDKVVDEHLVWTEETVARFYSAIGWDPATSDAPTRRSQPGHEPQ